MDKTTKKERNLILPEDNWESDLDNLGPFAPRRKLEDHLVKAPQDNETAQFFREYLGGHGFGGETGGGYNE